MKRRELLLAGVSAPFGSGCSESAIKAATGSDEPDLSVYFRYTIDLTVDGRDYSLVNGAHMQRWPGQAFGFAKINWLPFGGAVQLPTGEVLLAVPPSPREAIVEIMAGARAGGPEWSKASEVNPYVEAPYPDGAIPLVYIFDNGSAPTRAEAYQMRAALLDGDTRVSLRNLGLKRVDQDARKSVSHMFPAVSQAEELVMKGSLKRSGAPLFAPGEPNPIMMGGVTCLVRPVLAPFKFGGAALAYRSLNRALAAEQDASVWLEVHGQSSAGVTLRASADPRVGLLTSKQIKLPDTPNRVAEIPSEDDDLSIGGVKFLPRPIIHDGEEKSRSPGKRLFRKTGPSLSEDGSASVNVWNGPVPNILLHPIISISSAGPAWHQILDLTLAGAAYEGKRAEAEQGLRK